MQYMLNKLHSKLTLVYKIRVLLYLWPFNSPHRQGKSENDVQPVVPYSATKH